jgi:glycosyltransferase involved in cell wall biosynthesis
MKAVSDHIKTEATARLDQSGSRSEKAPMPGVIHVGLLTGGTDKPYAFGLADALVAQGVRIDFIGSDALDSPHLHQNDLIHFLNLRGDQNSEAGIAKKVVRVITYYARLVRYAAVAKPRIFHILWHNKFELIDRTILMVYYKLAGKKIAITAHNVNAATRDSKDSWMNRFSLAFQYRMADHIFVHTRLMKDELLADFSVPPRKVSVIPFGINNVDPRTSITAGAAKERLGITVHDRVILFFGLIRPYKGLEYLVSAMTHLNERADIKLIIAGAVQAGCADYWAGIQRDIRVGSFENRIIEKVHYIPDEDVELYFKAADVLALPYTHIFQSGLPFLAYSFGLPVIASDVGSLREDIIEGRTGLICAPRDAVDLANKIKAYFSSDLYLELGERRREICGFANERYSWTKVAETTTAIYQSLLANRTTATEISSHR